MQQETYTTVYAMEDKQLVEMSEIWYAKLYELI